MSSPNLIPNQVLASARHIDFSKKWFKLSDEEKETLSSLVFLFHFGESQTAFEIFTYLQNTKPEEREELFTQTEAVLNQISQGGLINPDLLEEYQNYLNEQLQVKGPKRTTRETVKYVYERYVQRKLLYDSYLSAKKAEENLKTNSSAQNIAQNTIEEQRNAIRETIDPKSEDLDQNLTAVNDYSQRIINEVVDKPLTPSQLKVATQILASAILGGTLITKEEITAPPTTVQQGDTQTTRNIDQLAYQEAVVTATLAAAFATGDFSDPISKLLPLDQETTLYQQQVAEISQSLSSDTSSADKDLPTTPDTDNLTADRLVKTKAEKVQDLTTTTEGADLFERVTKEVAIIQYAIANRPSPQIITAPSENFVSDARVLQFTKAVDQSKVPNLLPHPSFPDYSAQRASALIFGLKATVKVVNIEPNIPKLAAIFSAEQIRTAIRHGQNNPNSKIGQFISKNPEFTSKVLTQVEKYQKTALYQENRKQSQNTAQGPSFTSRLNTRYQQATNTLTRFIPSRFSQPLNIILHPGQALQSWAGKRAGQILSRQIQRIVPKIASRLAAKIVISEGIKKGLNTIISKLASQALIKAGGKLAASIAARFALGTAGGPIGWAVAALSIVGQFLLEKLFKNPEEIVGATVGIFTAPAAIIGTFAVTMTAASSAATTVGISTFLILFIYIATMTTAPLISTIAQLGSGIGPQQGNGGNPIHSPYTGPILPGCPSGWPTTHGHILQGPHGSFSHSLVEAVDITGVVTGDNVTSLTDGTVVDSGRANSSPVYGIWVIIQSTTQDGTPFQVVYGHLADVVVAPNDRVQTGQLIGYVDATSSNPDFRNVHLHLEYRGISYNSCPAGGIQIPDGCYGVDSSYPNPCLVNGQSVRY